jgi:hypothetical protein
VPNQLSPASPTGLCRLCVNERQLSRSHIIPNALFRRIKQRDAGKGVSFDDSKDGVVEHTSESWWEYLLCEDCEQRLAALDKAGVELLRAARKAANKPKDGVLVEPFDYTGLKRFLTSIVWRAAVSTLPEFHQVVLPSAYADDLRKSLLTERALAPNQLACRLEILFDATQASRGGFSADNLGQLIPSPHARLLSGRASFLFVLDGFLVELFAADAPHKEWRRLGMLKDERKFYIPPRNIFDVPELKQLLVAGFAKHIGGRESKSVKSR